MSDKPIINVMKDVNRGRNIFMGIDLRDLIHHSKKDKKLRAIYVYLHL